LILCSPWSDDVFSIKSQILPHSNLTKDVLRLAHLKSSLYHVLLVFLLEVRFAAHIRCLHSYTSAYVFALVLVRPLQSTSSHLFFLCKTCTLSWTVRPQTPFHNVCPTALLTCHLPLSDCPRPPYPHFYWSPFFVFPSIASSVHRADSVY